jgi:hypothetical protein
MPTTSIPVQPSELRYIAATAAEHRFAPLVNSTIANDRFAATLQPPTHFEHGSMLWVDERLTQIRLLDAQMQQQAAARLSSISGTDHSNTSTSLVYPVFTIPPSSPPGQNRAAAVEFFLQPIHDQLDELHKQHARTSGDASIPMWRKQGALDEIETAIDHQLDAADAAFVDLEEALAECEQMGIPFPADAGPEPTQPPVLVATHPSLDIVIDTGSSLHICQPGPGVTLTDTSDTVNIGGIAPGATAKTEGRAHWEILFAGLHGTTEGITLTRAHHCSSAPRSVISVPRLLQAGWTFSATSVDHIHLQREDQTIPCYIDHTGVIAAKQGSSQPQVQAQAFISRSTELTLFMHKATQYMHSICHCRNYNKIIATLNNTTGYNLGGRPITPDHILRDFDCNACDVSKITKRPLKHSGRPTTVIPRLGNPSEPLSPSQSKTASAPSPTGSKPPSTPQSKGRFDLDNLRPGELISLDLKKYSIPVRGGYTQALIATDHKSGAAWAFDIKRSTKAETDTAVTALRADWQLHKLGYTVTFMTDGDGSMTNVRDKAKEFGFNWKPIPVDDQSLSDCEQSIRHIWDAVKTIMLQNSGRIPINFWPQVLQGYLVHRWYFATTASRGWVTPYEAWFKRKPDCSGILPLGTIIVQRKPRSHRVSVPMQKLAAQIVQLENGDIAIARTEDPTHNGAMAWHLGYQSMTQLNDKKLLKILNSGKHTIVHNRNCKPATTVPLKFVADDAAIFDPGLTAQAESGPGFRTHAPTTATTADPNDSTTNSATGATDEEHGIDVDDEGDITNNDELDFTEDDTTDDEAAEAGATEATTAATTDVYIKDRQGHTVSSGDRVTYPWKVDFGRYRDFPGTVANIDTVNQRFYIDYDDDDDNDHDGIKFTDAPIHLSKTFAAVTHAVEQVNPAVWTVWMYPSDIDTAITTSKVEFNLREYETLAMLQPADAVYICHHAAAKHRNVFNNPNDVQWSKVMGTADEAPALVSAAKEAANITERCVTELLEADDSTKFAHAFKNATSARVVLRSKENRLTGEREWKSRICKRGDLEDPALDGANYHYAAEVVPQVAVKAAFFRPNRGKDIPGRGTRGISTIDVIGAFTQSDFYDASDPIRYVKWRDPTTHQWRVGIENAPLYGGKSAPMRFYKTISKRLLSMGFLQGFNPTASEASQLRTEYNATINNEQYRTSAANQPCVFYHPLRDLDVLIYVDDAFVDGYRSDRDWFFTTFHELLKCKPPTHLEPGTDVDFTGLIMTMTDSYAALHMAPYISRMIDEFGLADLPPTSTPITKHIDEDSNPLSYNDRSRFLAMVGAAGWVAQTVHLETRFAINRITRYISSPTAASLDAVKHLWRYLGGVRHVGLVLPLVDPEPPAEPYIVFCDADNGCNPEINNKRRGQYSYVLGLQHSAAAIARLPKSMCNLRFSPIALASKTLGVAFATRHHKTSHAAGGSGENEIYATANTINDLLRLSYTVEELGMIFPFPIKLHTDATVAEAFMNGTVSASRLHHVDRRLCWVQSCIDSRICTPVHVPGQLNFADIGTKVLQRVRFQQLRAGFMADLQPSPPHVRFSEAPTKAQHPQPP